MPVSNWLRSSYRGKATAKLFLSDQILYEKKKPAIPQNTLNVSKSLDKRCAGFLPVSTFRNRQNRQNRQDTAKRLLTSSVKLDDVNSAADAVSKGKENSTMKARGLLRHHFHGTYRCTIGLDLGGDVTPSVIEAVERQLGAGWSVAGSGQFVGHGDSAWLNAQKDKLVSWGADASKIDSLRHSVDFGEWFECTVPV